MENGRKTKPINTILFDLDNTLIATRKADKSACNQLSKILWEKFAVPVDCASTSCKCFLRSFRKCPENPSMKLDTWRRLLWIQALGDQYQKIADEIYQIWVQLRYEHLALAPDIHDLLKELRLHYFVGLITNGPSCSQWEKVRRLQLDQYFDVILVSGDLPWEKPHHKIFHEACDYLGVEPQQCVMVGDKLETDILGGIRAQLGGTVWVPLKKNEELMEDRPNPDFVLNDVTALPNLLPKNPKLLKFRNNRSFRIPLSDFEDANSNSSDGS